MNTDFEKKLTKSIIYGQLEKKCTENSQHEVLTLVSEVGSFAVMRLKTVIKNMPEFTLHDDVHIFNMLGILEKIIPASSLIKLSIPDLLMLILSVFLHDIGMAPDEKYIKAWKNQLLDNEYDEELQKEKENFVRFRLTFTHQLSDIKRFNAESEYSKAQLLEDYIITEYIRTTHSTRARKIIATYWDRRIMYQDTDLTEDLAAICFSHNENYTYLLNMETFKVCGQDTYLCLPFIATLLRLVDIIDFDPKRTPPVLFSHLAVKNPVSLTEWRKHQSIKAWTISSKKLVFSAQCEHPAIEAAIRLVCDQIDEELRNGTIVLSNLSNEGMDIDETIYRIPLPPRVDRQKIQAKKDISTGKPIYRYNNTKFTLNKKQIIDLLMGTKLYGKPDVALRELLQNSIDACLLRKKLSEIWGVEYNPKIKVLLYRRNNIDYMQVSDNGIGMNQHIVDNYYTNVGCSYYSSREFNELITSFKSTFVPISRFGIGILSCFMVSDSMEVITRRITGRFECDNALNILIEGLESLFVISDSNKEEPGTDTILTLRQVHPWERMNENEFVDCIRTIIPNPAVLIDIETDKGSVIHSSDYFEGMDLKPMLDYSWHNEKNIRKLDIDLECEEYGFKGKGCVGILVNNEVPVDVIEVLSRDVRIDEETYTLSSNIKYGINCISENSTSISVDTNGNIDTDTSFTEKFRSKSSLSIHGIEVPCDLFYNYTNRQSKTIIEMPFPFSFRLDIGQHSELNLNTARNQIVYDEKWLLFEENLYRIICKQLVSILSPSDWGLLKNIIGKNKDSVFNKIAQQFQDNETVIF
ncbi:MAG: ATP-binding protein [Treponema sp.]|nr:ATP-binding protein [Treponema sp.]